MKTVLYFNPCLRYFKTLLFLFFSINFLTAQVVIECNENVVNADRVIQDDYFIGGIYFSAIALSDKVRNACGASNGIKLIFSSRELSNSNPINASIVLSSNEINYQFISSQGLTNTSQVGDVFYGDFEFNNAEEGCAEVIIALPEINYEGDFVKDFIDQFLNVYIQNSTLSIIEDKDFMLYDEEKFELYTHFGNITSAQYKNIYAPPFGNPPSLHYFHEDFIINSDFVDFFEGIYSDENSSKQYFDNDVKILVEDGYSFRSEQTHLTACPDKVWGGIEALEGSEAELEDSWLSNGWVLLKAFNNSEIDLAENKFFNSAVGINMYDEPNLLNLTDNMFEDLELGIGILNANNLVIKPNDITKPNKFKRCENGIISFYSNNIECMYNEFEEIGLPNHGNCFVTSHSNVLISKNKFRNSFKGVYSDNALFTTIVDNQFENNDLGIDVRKNLSNHYTWANTITGKKGIRFKNCTSPHFDDNYINHDGDYPGELESYGINGITSNWGILNRNHFNSSDGSAAVKIDNSYTYVWNSEISLMAQNDIAGVRINGSMGSQIEYNDIEASQSSGTESFGIVLSGTGGVDVNCNDIYELEDGIVALDNTMGLNMQTNNLYSLGKGIKLENSMVGPQEHFGNIFYGPFSTADIYAVDMSTTDLLNSKFTVDSEENELFLPEVVSASSNIVIDISTLPNTLACNQNQYTTTNKNRLLSLCNVINSIRSNNTLDPIRKKNILAYYYKLILKYFPNRSEWPSCISDFMNSFTNTNVEKMGSVNEYMEAMLAKVEVNPTAESNHATALEDYLDDITNERDVSTSRASYYTASSSLETAWPDRTIQNQQNATAIENILNDFTPTDDYESAWLDYHISWLKSYEGEEFTQGEKENLEDLAFLCPIQFGDVVYGIRALVSEWNDIRFDLIECDEVSPRKGKQLTEVIISSLISPNPAYNFLNVNFSGEKASIKISTLDGKIVLKNEIKRDENLKISSLDNGIYIITVVNELGKSVIDKFIKVE